MNKLWEDLIKERIAINCITFEEAENLVELFRKNVNSGDMIFKDGMFECEGSNTCICFCNRNKEWEYGCIKSYKEENIEIISYNEFLEKININKPVMDGKLIVLVAPSSAGKDALQEIMVEEKKFLPIVSHTSRPMRKGEVEGKNYFFINGEEAHQMLLNDEFIEHREYETIDGEGKKQVWIYGISKKAIDDLDFESNNYVVIVDFQGLKLVEKYMLEKGIREKMISIFVKASSQTRLIRSLSREGNMMEGQVSEVIRRYMDDKENVEPAIGYCDVTITNEKKNDLTRNIKIIEAITG